MTGWKEGRIAILHEVIIVKAKSMKRLHNTKIIIIIIIISGVNTK